MIYSSSRAVQTYEPVAVIRKAGTVPLVEIRNTVFADSVVEYMNRGAGVSEFKITAMIDEEGNQVPKAHPGNRLFLKTEPDLASGEINGILRREKNR